MNFTCINLKSFNELTSVDISSIKWLFVMQSYFYRDFFYQIIENVQFLAVVV